MENSFSQQLYQRQEQTLTPSQLASLHILAAPLETLEQRINLELEHNPLLEAAVPPRAELIGDPVSSSHAELTAPDAPGYDGDEEDFSRLTELAEHWSDQPGDLPEAGNAEDRQAAQNRHDYLLSSLTESRSLADFLLEQLDFCDLPAAERQAAELVLGSIDERGFLATHPADIAMAADLELPAVEKAVKLVQSFDPPGVGARNVAESLKLQLERKHYPDPRIYQLLDEHLEEIETNKLPQAARSLGITLDELYGFLAELKKLNPSPASGFDFGPPGEFVAPEMALEYRDGELVITGRDRYLPRLRIVPRYLEMLEDPLTPPETRAYLREKLVQAEALLKGVALRQDTLSRITGVIAARQKAYFRDGIRSLVPMTMAEVAKALDLHETTVSRAVANKYLDTPQGLKEYRFFFSGGYQKADGEEISSRSVKEAIRGMIDAEDPCKPLSDAVIAARLSAKGLAVARRTVAKYRESLDIPPTSLRRRHR